MKKNGIMILGFVLLFILSISFFVYKSTFSYMDEKMVSVDKNKVELQELIVRTAYAFYDKNEFIQYESGNMLGISDDFMFKGFDVSPEDININNQVNMDNVSFLYSVYMNAINYNLGSLNEHSSDILSDIGFSYDDLEVIALNDNDILNVFTGYTEHYISGEELSKAFIVDFNSKLEMGDIVVYSKESQLSAFLYLGDNKFIYASGEDYKPLYNDFLDRGTLYITDSIFTDNKLDSDILYYSIIRPINSLIDNEGNAKGINLPRNSLSRIDGVYVSRYTDISVKDVYSGQKIKYLIEIKNDNSKVVTVNEIVDYIEGNMKFVSELSNYNGEFTDSTLSSDSFIKWDNISIPAGETVVLSYEVVAESSRVFEDPDVSRPAVMNKYSDGISRIKFDSDGYSLILSDIDFNTGIVFNEFQEEKFSDTVEEITSLNGGIEYSTDSDYQNEYKTEIDNLDENNPIHLYSYSFIKFIYYNALGLDLGNNDGLIYPNTILNNIFKYNEDGSYSRIFKEKTENVKDVSNMVVPSKYGGKLLKITSNITNMITMPYYSKIKDSFSYSYKEFLPGDIFCYWNKDANGELKAFSYMFLDSLYNEEDDSYSGRFIRYSGTGISIISGKQADEFINSLYSSDLFVVLRPSKVNYVSVDKIEMNDIILSVGKTQNINYNIVPLNGTVLSIEAESSDNKIFEVNSKNQIKGIGSGSAKLTVNFILGNGEIITEEVNVTVTNEDSIVNMNTGYKVYKEDKIIFTGFDNEIDIIENNIKFNEIVDIKFLNSSGEIVNNLVSEPVNMEVRYNDVLIDTYKIISISSDELKEDSDSGVDVIKYFDIGTTVNDILELMNINMNENEYSIIVYDGKSSNNSIKINDAVLNTGDIIEIKINEKVVSKYVISVTGDVNGDGLFKMTDLIKIRRHMVEYKNSVTGEIEIQKGANYFAMDMNKNGEIKLTDIIAFRRKLIEDYE